MLRFILMPLLLAAALAPAASAQTAAPDVQTQLQELRDRLEKLEGAPAKSSLGAFNPAIGMAVDGAFRDENDKASFLLRAAELNLEAPVDPYLKAWTVITASNDGVDLEEATLETTALPHNLTVRGGRLFANFGRQAHFHDHELPVIDRPRSLDTFVGGETRADGVEVQSLLPADFFLSATLGAYNKMGAGNRRADDLAGRPLDEFTYLARLNTYADLTDSQSVELGADSAWTPKRSVVPAAGGPALRGDTGRTLTGVDLTYRYQPAAGGLYKGAVWGTEVLRNDERRFDPAALTPKGRRAAWAGYSYVEVRSGRRLRGGVMADVTEDLDNPRANVKTGTAFLTFDVTEFQRLRAAFSEAVSTVEGTPKDHVVALQWTAVFGNHVHGFRDR